MIDPSLGASWALLAVGGAGAWALHPLLHRTHWRTGLESFALGVMVGPVLGWLDPSAQVHLTVAAMLAATFLGFSVGIHTDVRWFREWDGIGARGATWVGAATLTLVGALGLVMWRAVPAQPHVVAVLTVVVLVAATLTVMQDGRLSPSSRDLPGTTGRALQRLVLTGTGLGLAGAYLASLLFRFEVTTTIPSGVYLTLGASVALIGLAAWSIVGLQALLPARHALWGTAVTVGLVGVIGHGVGVFAPFLAFTTGLLVSLVARPMVVWGRRTDRFNSVLASPILLVAGATWVGDVGARIVGVAAALVLVRYLAHRLAFRALARPLGDGLHGMVWPTSALAFAIILESRAFGHSELLVDGRAAITLALAVVLVTSRAAVLRSLRIADPEGSLP